MLHLHNLPVCIDGRMLGADTGVGTYARMLRAAIRSIAPDRLLLGDGAIRGAIGASGKPARVRRFIHALSPTAHARFAEQVEPGERLLTAPDLFRRAQVSFDIYRRLTTVHMPGAPGLMHWTYPVPLRIAGWINLYTVHDAIPLRRPDLTPIDPVRHRRLLDRIVDRAAGIVTVSAAARDEIVAALGCPASFVADCSQAVDVTRPRIDSPLPAGLAGGGYLLVCGSVEPRKNIGRILAAHAASGATLPLVIAGNDGWHARLFADAMRSTPRVVRLSALGRDAMVALIAGARALLMPSLAEGFGLPVAEAMALGTPVLTATAGALAETAGGAALAVDPLDVDAIAAGIRRLTEDDDLCAALAAAGRRRAQAFAMPTFAARLRTAYERHIAPSP